MKADKPWWVKQGRFVVPATLRDKMRHLPEEERRFYCFIVSKIIVESKKHPALFHSVSSKYFKDFIGTDYRDYLNQLVDWQVIEINNSYFANAGKGFSKSYRLHPTARRAAKVKMSFAKKQVHPLRDRSKSSDEVLAFVLATLKKLTVRPKLLPQANIADEVEAEEWAEKIYFGQFNLHYGEKAGRLYHTVIQMPTIARRNLILKDNPSLPLFEYDVNLRCAGKAERLRAEKSGTPTVHLSIFLPDIFVWASAKRGQAYGGQSDIGPENRV